MTTAEMESLRRGLIIEKSSNLCYMKLLMICLVSSLILVLAKLMQEQ